MAKKFEVEVNLTAATATYLVEAKNTREALANWREGTLLSLDEVFEGVGVYAAEDFSDEPI